MLQTRSTFLLCSSNPDSWPDDGNLIFLGEWCKPYQSRFQWGLRNFSVAKPYGLQADLRVRNAELTNHLYSKMLAELTIGLNNLHGMNQPDRFWEIVIGHWLERYIRVLLNRFETIRSAVNSFKPSYLNLLFNSSYCLATKDSQSWFWATNDDGWNNVLIARLVEHLNFSNLEINYFNLGPCEFEIPQIPLSSPSRMHKLRRFMRTLLSRLSIAFQRNTDGLFLSTYVNRKVEIRTQLALGQFPQFWDHASDSIPTPQFDPEARSKLLSNLAPADTSQFEKVMRSLLPEIIPMSFVENFHHLCDLGNRKNWPRNPRFIFTSNNFDSDEVFKIWAADKVTSGVPYIIGQHGNSYGTNLYTLNPSREEIISTKFLTWGWGEGDPKLIPLFNFKVAGLRVKKDYMRRKHILLVGAGHDRGTYTWDQTSEIESYFEDQFSFTSQLNLDLKKRLIVKLYYDDLYTLGAQSSRWSDFDSSVCLDNIRSFKQLADKSRLLVFSYDSTGILELLAMNQPVIAFWQGGLNHLRESALPIYQNLIRVGIIHKDPESASQFVNDRWGSLNTWWESSEVQMARNAFCESYSRNVKHPSLMLTKVLKTLAQ